MTIARTLAETETNAHGMTASAWNARVNNAFTNGRYQLSDKRVVRITRLRLHGDLDWGTFGVHECWGVLADGTEVRVQTPGMDLKGIRRGGKLTVSNKALVDLAKAANRYARGLGLLDPTVVSTIY